MAWLINHKCSPADADLTPYAIMRGVRGGLELTRIVCTRPGGCREEFYVLGHDMFQEANSSDDLSRQSRPNLPPGFVIARTRPRE